MHGCADENAGTRNIRKRRRDVRWIQRPPTVDTHAAEQRHEDGKLHAVHMLWRHGRHDPGQKFPSQRGRRRPEPGRVQGGAGCKTPPRLGVWPGPAGATGRVTDHNHAVGRNCRNRQAGQWLNRSHLLDGGIVQLVTAGMLIHHLIDHRGNPRRRQEADLAADEHGSEGDEEVVAPLAEVQRRWPVG